MCGDILEKRYLRIFFIITLIFFIVSYAVEGSFDRVTKALAVVLIAFGYVTGVIASLVHLLLLFFGFLVSLPGISVLYALLVSTLAKIHFFIFGYLMKKLVTGSKEYKKLKAWVINSRIYQVESGLFHSFLVGLGLKKSGKVRLYDMITCPHCNKKIPLTGTHCPKCGKQFREKP